MTIPDNVLATLWQIARDLLNAKKGVGIRNVVGAIFEFLICAGAPEESRAFIEAAVETAVRDQDLLTVTVYAVDPTNALVCVLMKPTESVIVLEVVRHMCVGGQHRVLTVSYDIGFPISLDQVEIIPGRLVDGRIQATDLISADGGSFMITESESVGLPVGSFLRLGALLSDMLKEGHIIDDLGKYVVSA